MKKVLLYCLIPLLACACSGGMQTAEVRIPEGFQAETFLAKAHRLESLLSKEMVAEVVGIPVDRIEAHIEQDIRQADSYRLLYSWPTGKTKTVEDQFEIAEYHSIGIGAVQQLDVAGFEEYYGSNAGLQQQVDALSTQDQLDADIREMEARYIAGYAERQRIEKLSNVGTDAYWEQPLHALHVLADGVAFTISTNFGDKESLARKNALKLLDKLLNKLNN